MQDVKIVVNIPQIVGKNTEISCAKFTSYYELESAMLQNTALCCLVYFLKNVMHKYEIIRSHNTQALIWVQLFKTLIFKFE
jgi:hypothetical protein